jgi:hypothetical protein
MAKMSLEYKYDLTLHVGFDSDTSDEEEDLLQSLLYEEVCGVLEEMQEFRSTEGLLRDKRGVFSRYSRLSMLFLSLCGQYIELVRIKSGELMLTPQYIDNRMTNLVYVELCGMLTELRDLRESRSLRKEDALEQYESICSTLRAVVS